jgi:hypothetical protein
MTSADRDDLMPTQEKLEWVTPKISQMETRDTTSKVAFTETETTTFNLQGPS